MQFHEIANIFPMMTGDDYKALREDIKTNGLIEPIILYEGKILDGRNRYTACLDAGIEAEYEDYEGDDPQGYVYSKNFHRRHLSKEQRNELMRQMRAEGRTYQAIADIAGVSLGKAYQDTKDVELFNNEKLRGEDDKYRPSSYEKKHVHVSANSGNNEWYTPPEIINKAHEVMGEIDLDPASSDLANKTVRANKYYTAENDGLAQEWSGKLWMNPPYSRPEIDKFSRKLTDDIRCGNIEEAIVLVNNATETAWFQNMLAIADAVCFIKGRIKFIDINGNPSGAPLQGQALIYFGINKEVFTNIYSEIGVVVWNAEK